MTCSHALGAERECVLEMHDPNSNKKTKSVRTGQNDAQSLLVLSNDQVVIGFENGSIKIFDLNGEKTRAIYKAHESDVSSLFQLSNGKFISSGKDEGKHTIKMWNLADLSLLQKIETDHDDTIQSIDVSKDETFLATGSADSTIKIWPIQSNS